MSNNFCCCPSCLLLPFSSLQHHSMGKRRIGVAVEALSDHPDCFFPVTTMLYTSQPMGYRGQSDVAGGTWVWGWTRDVLLPLAAHVKKPESLRAKQAKTASPKSQHLHRNARNTHKKYSLGRTLVCLRWENTLEFPRITLYLIWEMLPSANGARHAVVQDFSVVTQRAACHPPCWITNASWSTCDFPGSPTLPAWDEVIWLQTKSTQKSQNWIQRDKAERYNLDFNKLRLFIWRHDSFPTTQSSHPPIQKLLFGYCW